MTFRSNILGTTFSLWFQVIKGLTNTMPKVLHHIPCSFLSGCLQTFKNSTKINHLKRGVYYYISNSMTPKLVIPGINGISWIPTSFMKNLDLQQGQQQGQGHQYCSPMVRDQYKIKMIYLVLT